MNILICIAIISVYHSLSNRYRMFRHDLHLGIQRCFEYIPVHVCLGDHESYSEDITHIIKLRYIYVNHITRFIFEVNQINLS